MVLQRSPDRASISSSLPLTSGHSHAAIEYITESRTNPSGMIMCARKTPSLRAPMR